MRGRVDESKSKPRFRRTALIVQHTRALSAIQLEGIVRRLPNPHGDDEQLETVTLRNRGASAVPLAGWILRDRSGLTWTLSGTLSPGQSLMFRRSGQAMSLNNAGDEIELIDSNQLERDRFAYQTSSEGAVIQTLH